LCLRVDAGRPIAHVAAEAGSVTFAPRSGLTLAAPPSQAEKTGQAFNRMCVRRGVVRFAVCRS